MTTTISDSAIVTYRGFDHAIIGSGSYDARICRVRDDQSHPDFTPGWRHPTGNVLVVALDCADEWFRAKGRGAAGNALSACKPRHPQGRGVAENDVRISGEAQPVGQAGLRCTAFTRSRNASHEAMAARAHLSTTATSVTRTHWSENENGRQCQLAARSRGRSPLTARTSILGSAAG